MRQFIVTFHNEKRLRAKLPEYKDNIGTVNAKTVSEALIRTTKVLEEAGFSSIRVYTNAPIIEVQGIDGYFSVIRLDLFGSKWSQIRLRKIKKASRS